MTLLRGQCYFSAVVASSFCVAPIIFVSLFVTQPSSAQELAHAIFATGLQATTHFAILGWLALALFALVPVAFGTAIMAALGGSFAWARSWTAWGVAGALPLLVAALPILDVHLRPGSVLGVAMIGAGCALVSRAFIRWAEPLPQA